MNTRPLSVVVAGLVAMLSALVLYLTRPLDHRPRPAQALQCLDLERGRHMPLETPAQAFGIGLSYAGHIEETASSFDPRARAPVFLKHDRGVVRDGAQVAWPTPATLFAEASDIEPGLETTLGEAFPEMDPLLDYEVELGIVLLEDLDPSRLKDPGFAPRLGFFVANDLSSRALGLLGEGRDNRYDYWGLSKSLPGFMPISSTLWVPDRPVAGGIPCVDLETRVNGELRQRQNTSTMIYTPREMLTFVHEAFPRAKLRRGTVVLTGTPAGVAIETPRWMVRMSELLGLSRMTKLRLKLGQKDGGFLAPGDEVEVRAAGLGRVGVTIAPSR